MNERLELLVREAEALFDKLGAGYGEWRPFRAWARRRYYRAWARLERRRGLLADRTRQEADHADA